MRPGPRRGWSRPARRPCWSTSRCGRRRARGGGASASAGIVTWRGPCRAVAPVLEKLAEERKGKLKIVKLNVDENPRMQAVHRVQSIPTLMLTRGPLFLDKVMGALPKEALESWIDRYV